MYTFKHSRNRNGLLTTALTAGALALGLASSNALAMGGPTSHDLDLDAALVKQAGTAVNRDYYIGGRVGALPRVREQATTKRTTSVSSEEYIGGRVGRLPRPTADQ